MDRFTTKRSYLDPIHHEIVLDRKIPAERLIIDLIDTEEFQRLRRIHQLGVTFFTFQGAEGSRFTHSVGVMHVASQLINLASEKTPILKDLRPLILASALLHDVGHGPFSHVTEKILHYDHENWSCRIISEGTGIYDVLSSFSDYPNLAGNIVKVLKKEHQPKFVSHMVSSQLDCDRMDYLLRDSYMTGTAYGMFALQRILSSLEINEIDDRIEVVGEKGQAAVEDYLFARYSMYAQVYYHRKNLAARALLSKLIKRARYLMEEKQSPLSFIDAQTQKWLCGEELSVQEYLSLDDVQLTYHIKRWAKDPDPVLSDLASRFLNRRIFKATKIPLMRGADEREGVLNRAGNGEQKHNGHHGEPVMSSEQAAFIADITRQANHIVAQAGLDPDYYVSTESTGFRPYDYYRPDEDHPQTNIVVRTDDGTVSELSELSLTVEALVHGKYEQHWLVYPAEVSEKIALIKELSPAR